MQYCIIAIIVLPLNGHAFTINCLYKKKYTGRQVRYK